MSANERKFDLPIWVSFGVVLSLVPIGAERWSGAHAAQALAGSSVFSNAEGATQARLDSLAPEFWRGLSARLPPG